MAGNPFPTTKLYRIRPNEKVIIFDHKNGKAKFFDKAAMESLNKSDAVALTGDASVLTVQRWFSSHIPGLKKTAKNAHLAPNGPVFQACVRYGSSELISTP